MPANVDQALELGLREAAETVWARKVAIESLDPRDPFATVVGAARAHAQAIGRAEGIAFALELARDNGIEAEELVERAIHEVGMVAWDRGRVDAGAHHPGMGRVLDRIRLDCSWSTAAFSAAQIPRPL